MKKGLSVLLCLIVFALPLSGCFYLKHTVGTGGSGQVMASERQWYAIWGLIPIGQIDSAKLARGAKNYTIESQVTFVDWLLGLLLNALIPTTIYAQTVTVTK